MMYDAISPQQFKNHDKRLQIPQLAVALGQSGTEATKAAIALSIKRTVKNFIDKPGGQRNQDQVRADLLPFVAVIVGQPADQSAIEFFGDAGWKRFAPGKVLLNTRWQIGPWAPVACVHANDLEHAATVDARAVAPVPTATAAGTLALVAMAALVALALASLTLVALVAMGDLPATLAITGISQRRHRATDQRQTSNRRNQ